MVKNAEKNLENNHDDAKVMVSGKIIVYPLEIHSQLKENKVFLQYIHICWLLKKTMTFFERII